MANIDLERTYKIALIFATVIGASMLIISTYISWHHEFGVTTPTAINFTNPPQTIDPKIQAFMDRNNVSMRLMESHYVGVPFSKWKPRDRILYEEWAKENEELLNI